MTLNSAKFLIGLISLTLFQVAVVLEFQLEDEMQKPVPVYDTTDAEADIQYPKIHQDKMIETQSKELEKKMEDGKIIFSLLKETDNLRDQHQVHNNLEYHTFFLSERAVEVYTEIKKNHTLKKTRSIVCNSTALDEQFERFCSSVGSQPCTCYYPDHKSIPQFELGNDELTKNASGLNGTGPGNCQDLKDLGYKLEGLYLVRFNSKRIKTIYCSFNNETIKNTKNQDRNKKDTHPKEGSIGRSSKTIIRFCGGVKGKQCTYLYSDYPDAPQMGNVNLVRKEPTSCEDLSLIGHILRGFYMVWLNTIKVKILYCDFKNQTTIGNYKGANTECISNLNNKSQPLYCNGLGSQPCSCYYSNSPNISQFELSNDETTIKALKDNGPTSCEDLKTIGYTIKGFYMVRFKAMILKTIFCEFHQTSTKKDSPYPDTTTMSSSTKAIKIEYRTTPKKLTSEKYNAVFSTSISTLQPRIRPKMFVKNSGSVYGFSKTTPVMKNYGTFYLLKNKRNKCASSGLLNPFGPYESDCNANDKNQYWKWCGNKNICNHQNKLLSTIFTGNGLSQNGKEIKKFSIELLMLQKSSHVINQEWRLTGLEQLLEIENVLCLGVAYGGFYQQNHLLTIGYCDQNDSGQFWSFDSILTPTSISTPSPQVVGFHFPGNPTISQPAIKASEMIPLTRKDGKSYLLKNKRNKCMSCGFLNRRFPYEDNCNPKDKYQHWRWCGDNQFCNYLGKFLSKEYLGLDRYPNGTTEKGFHIKILESSKDVVQKWSATGLGQLVDIEDGLCLGVSYNSVDRQHLLIGVQSCEEKDDGQFWSFESLTFSTSEAQFRKFDFSDKPTSTVTKSTILTPLYQKNGKSYHLMNKHNKCISSKNINELEIGAVQSSCNATETRQLWKWSGDNLCSDFGCLSKVQKYGQSFQVLLGEENYDSPWVNQNWSATNQGQILSSSGLCLGAEKDSDFHDVLLTVEICDQHRKGQIWSLTTIWF